VFLTTCFVFSFWICFVVPRIVVIDFVFTDDF